jgi:hypothetical protein
MQEDDLIHLESGDSSSDSENGGSLPFLTTSRLQAHAASLFQPFFGRPGMGTDPFLMGLEDGPRFGETVNFSFPASPYGGASDPFSRLLMQALVKTERHINFGEGDCDYDETTGKCTACGKIDPEDARSHFERRVCSTPKCKDRRLTEITDSNTGETDGWVCSGVKGCQRKWNGAGDEIELIPQNIYLAGDWLEPPMETVQAFEDAGCHIVHKWWNPEERGETTNTLEQLSERIEEADWFILDMRSSRFGRHYFGGSHIGLGIAFEQGAHIMVIAPSEQESPGLKKPARTYTSLVTPLVVDNEFGALEVLRQQRYGIESDDDDDEECWMDVIEECEGDHTIIAERD